MHGRVLPPGRAVSDQLPATERSASLLRSPDHLQPALLPIIHRVVICQDSLYRRPISNCKSKCRPSPAKPCTHRQSLLRLPPPFSSAAPPLIPLFNPTCTITQAAELPLSPRPLCDTATIKVFIRNYKLVNLTVALCLSPSCPRTGQT